MIRNAVLFTTGFAMVLSYLVVSANIHEVFASSADPGNASEIVEIMQDDSLYGIILEKISKTAPYQQYKDTEEWEFPYKLVAVDENGIKYNAVFYKSNDNGMHSILYTFDKSLELIDCTEALQEHNKLTVIDHINDTNETYGYSIYPTNTDCITWVCTAYETIQGGEVSSICTAILGATFSWATQNYNLSLVGYILAELGIVKVCTVPPSKYCIQGKWSRICPW